MAILTKQPFLRLNTKKVWDVQRLPAFPVAGQDWNLSGLKDAFDAKGSTIDWGNDRYLMLVPRVDNSNDVNSLINDVNRTGSKYNVSLALFESNGTLVKVVSKWGKIAGIGEKGFMYEEEGQYGTFFSVAAVPATAIIRYKPTLAVITKMSEIVNSSDLTRSLEKSSGITEGTFFNAKYTKENVWDVQRSPAYPIAGREWTLSGLKSSLDNTGTTIDWGNGRYLMLVAEVDNARSPNSLIDDINNNGTKQNVSLKLYESDGRLVKVVSKWGRIIGRGDKGFMYDVEGRYGTFLSVALVDPSVTIKYTPSLAAVTKLSELVNSSDLTKGLENEKSRAPGFRKMNNDNNAETPSKIIAEATFFNAKYTKENIWDVQRAPAYPIAGREWTLSGLKSSLDNTGKAIDWGNGRYLMLTAEVDNARSPYSLTDDINNNGTKQNVSLKLYESDGRLVKVVSKWGRIIGRGDKGFMYDIEGRYGTFFSVALIDPSATIKYTPSLAAVTKLSELVNSSDLTKGLENEKSRAPGFRKMSDDSKGVATANVSTGTSLLKIKYTKNMAWEVEIPREEPVAGTTLSYSIKGPARSTISFDKAENVDWGKNGDRYIMFVVEEGRGQAELEDDINNNQAVAISANLFERNGTKVEGIYTYGEISAIGDKGFVYNVSSSEFQIRIFFSKMVFKQTDVITNRITIPRVTKLSQL
ncbi:MAG: hypothetical protein GZ094_20625 [Mariniphaga sp.]|nr:hypothetical protein [Mariniphaga sp.]